MWWDIYMYIPSTTSLWLNQWRNAPCSQSLNGFTYPVTLEFLQTYLLIQLDKLAGPHLLWRLKVCSACDKILRQTVVVVVLGRVGSNLACSPSASHLLTAAIFSTALRLCRQPTAKSPSTLLSRCLFLLRFPECRLATAEGLGAMSPEIRNSLPLEPEI